MTEQRPISRVRASRAPALGRRARAAGAARAHRARWSPSARRSREQDPGRRGRHARGRLSPAARGRRGARGGGDRCRGRGRHERRRRRSSADAQHGEHADAAPGDVAARRVRTPQRRDRAVGGGRRCPLPLLGGPLRLALERLACRPSGGRTVRRSSTPTRTASGSVTRSSPAPPVRHSAAARCCGAKGRPTG